MARDVYGSNPPEPAGRRSSLPVIKAVEVAAVVRSEDLYVKADHWVGMKSTLTVCTCLCHHPDGNTDYPCDDMKGRPQPNWCNASTRR